MSFLFVKEPKDWFLKIQSIDDLLNYYYANDLFEEDKQQYIQLQNNPYCNDDTCCTHTVFGWFINNGKEHGISYDEMYKRIADVQFRSMLKVLNKTGTIYVNRKGGFHPELENETYSTFVHKDKLEFPKCFTKDIRVEKFYDGIHWYAYVGDIQVRDGNILKWNTYDEAYKQAQKICIDYKEK